MKKWNIGNLWKKYKYVGLVVLAGILLMLLPGKKTDAQTQESGGTSAKAIAAGIAIGLAAAGGAIAMGMAVSKSAEGISRQPEAEGKIRTTLMLGLVFIETAIIYALLVVILIIFVL